jgi:hypothetical protein
VLIPGWWLLARSASLVRQRRTPACVLQLCGAACLMIVILTHIAEALHLLQFMGWGEAHSAGHYLDLSSAVLAVTLLPVGWLLGMRRRVRRS